MACIWACQGKGLQAQGGPHVNTEGPSTQVKWVVALCTPKHIRNQSTSSSGISASHSLSLSLFFTLPLSTSLIPCLSISLGALRVRKLLEASSGSRPAAEPHYPLPLLRESPCLIWCLQNGLLRRGGVLFFSPFFCLHLFSLSLSLPFFFL